MHNLTLKDQFKNDNLFVELVEKSTDMIMVLNEDLSVYYCNAQCENALALPRKDIMRSKKPLTEIFNLSDAQIINLFSTLQTQSDWQGELDLSDYQGKEWGLVKIYKRMSPVGMFTQWVLFKTDITEQKMNERLMHHRAHFDNITMLPNAASLSESLTLTNYAGRSLPGKKYALVTVAIDNLNYIEEIFGKAVVNELLAVISSKFLSIPFAKDSLYSTAHGEYAFLLEKETVEDVGSFADFVLKDVINVYTVNNVNIYINASAGISIYPDDCDDADMLLLQSRAALHAIRSSRSGAYAYFNKKMLSDMVRITEINKYLHAAVEKSELSLRFQPKYDTKTKKIVGAEVLLRWISPEIGNVPPPEFIPVAEEYGHIGQITKWVFRQTCKYARQWRESGVCDLEFAVNVSARQLYDIAFVAEIKEIADFENHPIEKLDIEITESVLVANTQMAKITLEKLQNHNMRIAIDDFGTGYSSLSYLTKFPINYLKIDRSFIMNIPGDRKSSNIVSTIITMGKNLGMKIIAEGVETEEQYRYLLGLDCDQIQGYYFSKPLTADEFEALIISCKECAPPL